MRIGVEGLMGRGRQVHRGILGAGLALAVVAAGTLASGCQRSWSDSDGPVYSSPPRGGTPVVSVHDAVDALRDQGFDVDEDRASIRFGLRRDTEVYVHLGRNHADVAKGVKADAEARRGDEGLYESRAVCNVIVQVFRIGVDARGERRDRKAERAALARAVPAVERVLAPRCSQGQNLTPKGLADAVWASDLDFEVRAQEGAQVFAPALEIRPGGGVEDPDYMSDVGVSLFENSHAATNAMKQVEQEDEYQSDAPSQLRASRELRACNAVISFWAPRGDGPKKAHAREVARRAERVAKALRDSCQVG